MRKFLLGLDGGGGKTLALLADAKGRRRRPGQRGRIQLSELGETAAWAALDTAIAAAFADAGPATGRRRGGRAGAGGRGSARISGALRGVGSRTILRRAGGDRHGCRTGAGGRHPRRLGHRPHFRHRVHRVRPQPAWRDGTGRGVGTRHGRRGERLAIGVEALRQSSACRRWPRPGHCGDRCGAGALGAEDAFRSCRSHDREFGGAAEIATLAALVDAAARDGDVVAADILREAGRELALTVQAVVRRLALPMPASCALAGGVIFRGQVVRTAFLTAAEALGLRLDPITLVIEPARARSGWPPTC